MKNKLFKKPSDGRVHLHMSSVGAKKVLTRLAPMFASKLSILLGGTPVSPRVVGCPRKPGYFRLLFDVPLGTRLPEGVDTLAVKGEEILRVVTFPLEALSVKLYDFVMRVPEFLECSKISPDGSDLLLRFNGSESQLSLFRTLTKNDGIPTRDLGEPKRGERKPGLYVVTKLETKKKPVSRPQKATPRKMVKKGSFDLSPDSVFGIAQASICALPVAYRNRLISSVLGDLTPEEFVSVVSEVMPHGLLLQTGAEMPLKKKGSGIVLKEDCLVAH
jgi:hypothetical protein